jgi:hypothetical protein
MSGPGAVLQVIVISGSGIFIGNNGGNGSAAGKSVQNSSKKFRPVLFFPWGGPVMLSGSTAVKELLKLIGIHRQTRWNSVKHHAHSRTVGLTENG